MKVGIDDWSDEELLKEFQWAAGHIPDGDVGRPSSELEKILSRVEEERDK